MAEQPITFAADDGNAQAAFRLSVAKCGIREFVGCRQVSRGLHHFLSAHEERANIDGQFCAMARSILANEGFDPDRFQRLTGVQLESLLLNLSPRIPVAGFSADPQGPSVLVASNLIGRGAFNIFSGIATTAAFCAFPAMFFSEGLAISLNSASFKLFKIGLPFLLLTCPEGVRVAWNSPSRGSARYGRIFREFALSFRLIALATLPQLMVAAYPLGAFTGRLTPLADSMASSKILFTRGWQMCAVGLVAGLALPSPFINNPAITDPTNRASKYVSQAPRLVATALGIYLVVNTFTESNLLNTPKLVELNAHFQKVAPLYATYVSAAAATIVGGPNGLLEAGLATLIGSALSFIDRWVIRFNTLSPANQLIQARFYLKTLVVSASAYGTLYSFYRLTEDEPLTRDNRDNFGRLLNADIPRAAAQGIFPTQDEANFANALVTRTRQLPAHRAHCANAWQVHMEKVREQEAAAQAED